MYTFFNSVALLCVILHLKCVDIRVFKWRWNTLGPYFNTFWRWSTPGVYQHIHRQSKTSWCLFASFSVPSFLDVIWALWLNETGKGSLSKVVQWVWNYLQLNFQKDWSSTAEVMADIRDGIIIWTSFLFASFSVPSFLASFKRFWSNETGKGSLSKVVQRVRNYLQLNFQKDWSSTSEVMADIRDGIIIRTSFLFLFFLS